MALTDEQRAMLQLLLEGGQSYDDIGSLLGIPPDEVRSRAHAALRDMAGADPDAQVGLSDYLLGQADPIGRADAVRHLQSDPDGNALADRLVQQLRLIAPKANLPDVPSLRGGRRRAPVAPAPSPSAPEAPAASSVPGPPAPSSTKGPGVASRAAGAISGLGRRARGGGGDHKRRNRITVAAAAGLALVIVLIVLLTGGGDGGEDCTPVDTSQAEQAGIPTIKLVATGEAAEADCEPTGQITLSTVQPQQNQQQQNQQPQFALQINAANLEPTGEGNAYLLWLYTSDQEAFPLGQQTVTEDGNLTGAVPLNSAQILLLTAFETVRLARATEAEVQQVEQSVQAAGQGRNATGVVPFVGIPALEGQVAELGLDQLLQQAQQQAGGAGATPPQGGQGTGQ